MTGGLDSLPERVQLVEHKLERLTASVEMRFDGVDEAFADQRLYTELAYGRLESKMDAGFARVDQRFGEIDASLGQIHARLAPIEQRFEQTDGRLARLERKIDQIIDLQLRKLPPDASS